MPIYIQRLGVRGEYKRSPVQRFLGRALALIATVGVLAVALMFSLIFFAIALTAGALIGGRIWWRLRTLRKSAPDLHASNGAGGRIIEGEVLPNEEQSQSALDSTRR